MYDDVDVCILSSCMNTFLFDKIILWAFCWPLLCAGINGNFVFGFNEIIVCAKFIVVIYARSVDK